MPVCGNCRKWQLLGDDCPVCQSQKRISAAIAADWLPATFEASAKVTKILDSAFYSISRLVADEESPKKGASAPRKRAAEERTKGEASPKAGGESDPQKEVEKREEIAREEPDKRKVSEKKEPVESTRSEGSKGLPRKKVEEEQKRARSRTPQRQREKDKRKKRDSKSRSVSGSRTRRKKREDHSPKAVERRGEETSLRTSSGIEREPFLRPRPSQRAPRSPRTPDHPPPREPLIPPAAGRDKLPGSGWRGPVPYSNHPRWSEGTNKGVTKRAKQELYDRKNYRGRW